VILPVSGRACDYSWGWFDSPFGLRWSWARHGGNMAGSPFRRNGHRRRDGGIVARWPGAAFLRRFPALLQDGLQIALRRAGGRGREGAIVSDRRAVSRSKCGRRCWRSRRAIVTPIPRSPKQLARPQSVRAVAQRWGATRSAGCIPCHRALRKSAAWEAITGIAAKRVHAAFESARAVMPGQAVGGWLLLQHNPAGSTEQRLVCVRRYVRFASPDGATTKGRIRYDIFRKPPIAVALTKRLWRWLLVNPVSPGFWWQPQRPERQHT